MKESDDDELGVRVGTGTKRMAIAADASDAMIWENIFHKNREISILTMKKKQQG